MIVDAVLQTGIARRIRAGLAFERERSPIGKDQPGPDQEDPTLADGDSIVVSADQAGALRDQKKAARRAVIDILGDLRGDLTWQVGANAGDQRGRDD